MLARPSCNRRCCIGFPDQTGPPPAGILLPSAFENELGNYVADAAGIRCATMKMRSAETVSPRRDCVVVVSFGGVQMSSMSVETDLRSL